MQNKQIHQSEKASFFNCVQKGILTWEMRYICAVIYYWMTSMKKCQCNLIIDQCLAFQLILFEAANQILPTYTQWYWALPINTTLSDRGHIQRSQFKIKLGFLLTSYCYGENGVCNHACVCVCACVRVYVCVCVCARANVCVCGIGFACLASCDLNCL